MGFYGMGIIFVGHFSVFNLSLLPQKKSLRFFFVKCLCFQLKFLASHGERQESNRIRDDSSDRDPTIMSLLSLEMLQPNLTNLDLESLQYSYPHILLNHLIDLIQ